MKTISGIIRKANFSVLLSAVTHALAWVSAITLFILMLFITSDVIGRYVFSKPLPGSYELASTSLAFIIFLSLAYLEIRGMHIRLFSIYNLLGLQGKNILNIIAYFIGVMICGLIALQAWDWAWVSWLEKDYMEGQVNFPYYPSKFAAALGMTAVLIVYLLKLIKTLIALFTEVKS